MVSSEFSSCRRRRTASDDSKEAKADKKVKDDDQIALPGNFAAVKAHVVQIVPKEWTEYTVVKAMPHGTRTNKGATLIELDATNGRFGGNVYALHDEPQPLAEPKPVAAEQADDQQGVDLPALEQDARRVREHGGVGVGAPRDVDRVAKTAEE